MGVIACADGVLRGFNSGKDREFSPAWECRSLLEPTLSTHVLLEEGEFSFLLRACEAQRKIKARF